MISLMSVMHCCKGGYNIFESLLQNLSLFCRSLPDLELVSLNFSSATTPALILKTFEHHCEYKRTPKGIVLRPNQMGKWLVIFCDEINLPAPDNYGTQRGNGFFT
jgi:dynein heavy chain 1